MEKSNRVLAFCWGLLFSWGVLIPSWIQGEVIINEIHYNPDVKTEPAEFIELYNTANSVVDLSGWSLSNGINYTFPTATLIGPESYLVVAQDPDFLRQKFGAPALGPFTGLLRNSGDKIVLQNALEEIEDEVEYKLGFPWPTVGDPPGYSIELVHPAFDNNLGGSWRPSVRGDPTTQSQTLLEAGASWKYSKGIAEASNPTTAWRQLDFDDSQWPVGLAPIGYDPSLPLRTTLDDMAGNYSSVFFRNHFLVSDPSQISALILEALYDDGFKVWINGVPVLSQSLPTGEVAFDALATGSARESADYDVFLLNSARAYLVPGLNVIAVQAHNILLEGSSDFFLDIRLRAQLGSATGGPTPGARNAVYGTNLPPHIRQVEHRPQEPVSGVPVRISAKITDVDGVANVALQYQIVEAGDYIELTDPAYQTNWTTMMMSDGGTSGDAVADDGIFTIEVPAVVQRHRRLIRYRIIATDNLGTSITAPYPDDPAPNFAYFVYDGVPAWTASLQPGDPAVEYGTNVMRRLPVYHLISKKDSVEHATWRDQYQGDLYRWTGTLVYDGKVYDHIRYRARGGVWRYAMGKNMWKFDFNRGHSFEARDDYGKKDGTAWTKLNLGACIQQGDYLHRGEHGMFEAVGFRLFNLAGVDAPRTHWVQFRIIDQAAEANPTNQYTGDFWGLYLVMEQEDGRFLDEHDLPDGNFYKMEGGTGTLNNQGATAVTDKSDLNSFLNLSNNTTPSDELWRKNLNLPKYYGYQAILQGIHHYDIADGKNYFYYLNPEKGQWSVHPWDLDLTWADNMYRAGVNGGDEPFKSAVLKRPQFKLEYQNRVREIRDLLFNSDQAFKLIDEYAAIVRGSAGVPSILDADRAQWDFNPLMRDSGIVNLSKAGQGRYYKAPEAPTKDFPGMVQLMKNYASYRGALLDDAANDPDIPGTPALTFVGAQNYALDRLTFRSSDYRGTAPFRAMNWRLAEVTDINNPSFDALEPRRYEIAPAWESGELSSFLSEITIPANPTKVGHTYRVRVRMEDVQGRSSHWSPAIEFTAQEPANGVALLEDLHITELMYSPVSGTSFEFIELHNANPVTALDLSVARFTQGIDFTFAQGTLVPPNGYVVLVQLMNENNFATFRQHYGLDNSVLIAGPFAGNLDNQGERITLKTAAGGAEIFSLQYDNGNGWPALTGGVEQSLHRISIAKSLADPRNWVAASPTPGRPDAPEPDNDGDGLPDAWEIAAGLNPNAASDAGMDSDQDGLTNLQEFLAGTNPRDPKSFLGLEVFPIRGSVFLRFTAVPAKSYVLQYRDSVSSGDWIALKMVQPGSATQNLEISDTPPSGTRARFYRLAVR